MKIVAAAALVLVLIASPAKCQKKKDVCPAIRTKQDWGGAPATWVHYQIIPVQYVIIQHTVTKKCDTAAKCSVILKSIQSYHKSIKYDDIGYNFLIGNDGVVYEGRGWHKVGAHTRGYNSNATGIAFIGDFSNSLPTKKALNAAKKLLKCGVESGELSPNYRLLAARQVHSTVSPGQPIYEEIQYWDNWSESP